MVRRVAQQRQVLRRVIDRFLDEASSDRFHAERPCSTPTTASPCCPPPADLDVFRYFCPCLLTLLVALTLRGGTTWGDWIAVTHSESSEDGGGGGGGGGAQDAAVACPAAALVMRCLCARALSPLPAPSLQHPAPRGPPLPQACWHWLPWPPSCCCAPRSTSRTGQRWWRACAAFPRRCCWATYTSIPVSGGSGLSPGWLILPLPGPAACGHCKLGTAGRSWGSAGSSWGRARSARSSCAAPYPVAAAAPALQPGSLHTSARPRSPDPQASTLAT